MNKVVLGLLSWLWLISAIGMSAGVASALFLLSLELVTGWRESDLWIILALPLLGFAVGWMYHRWGRSVEGGNNLILNEIHEPRAPLPLRMAGLILLGTLMTHLGGGSAGREGTAVQMGGSLADQWARWHKVSPAKRRMLLMVGMSAGFASVFGVPLAGTIFGLEVLGRGHFEWRAFLPCLGAAFLAHYACLALGVHHSLYASPALPVLESSTFGWIAAAALIFGGVAWLFARLTDELAQATKRFVSYPPLRPALGGVVVLMGYYVVGHLRFAGLGVAELQSAVTTTVPVFDWAGKAVFTVLTLGFGFKGGEVTPLLFIGATLGNALGTIIPLSPFFLAELGFVAVFAGAAQTPLACTLMGMEIFGFNGGLFLLLACMVSATIAGHPGIYHAQRHRPWRKLFRRNNRAN